MTVSTLGCASYVPDGALPPALLRRMESRPRPRPKGA